MYLSLDEFYKLCGIYANIKDNNKITEDEINCLGDIIKSIEDRRKIKNKKNRENMRKVRNSNATDPIDEVIDEVVNEVVNEVVDEVVEEINPEDELSEEDVDLLDFLDSII